jgi:acyl-CoA synthetase (AMP-forming)/AMP-acid ligase II
VTAPGFTDAAPRTVPFLDAERGDAPCLLDDRGGAWIGYGALAALAAERAATLAGPKALVFLYMGNDVASVAALLGALAAGHAVALLDPNLPAATRAGLHAAYGPDILIEGGVIRDSEPRGGGPIHADLGVLLSTSGSTGSPKFVRLSVAALASNARAIAEVLRIGPEDVAAGHLPLHYSFGLSVLTSHLVRGARIRLTGARMTERPFWDALSAAAVTHLPGVPFHFQTMGRLGYGRLRLPTLRSMVQAGGFLDGPAREAAHAFMESRGGRFAVLYGQTEAAPRMTTLTHEAFASAPASVGAALPGGAIEIREPDAHGHGEVVYRGPNVMLGYAESRADLALGDVMEGCLPTGDIGFLDAAGRLTLTGRIGRQGKLFGLRINLDEVEKALAPVRDVAVLQGENALAICYREADAPAEAEGLRRALLDRLAASFTIPVSGYRLRPVTHIPRTERGKIDYGLIGTWLNSPL